MTKTNKILIASSAGLVSLGAAALFLLRNRIGKRIVKTAKSFLGQKEIHPNKSFLNQAFQNLMYNLGNWRPGWEWCASFARMVWMLSLKDQQKSIASKLLSPSSQQTFIGFAKDNSGLFYVGQQPNPGSIVIWQSTKEPHKGHAGIYVGKIAGQHVFVEGNRNNQVTLTRYGNYHQISKILKLRGFITAK